MPQVHLNGTMLDRQLETAPPGVELKLTATTALLCFPCGCQSIVGKVRKDTFKTLSTQLSSTESLP